MLYDVARPEFVPPPRGTSSIVRLTPRKEPPACNAEALQRMTEAAFGQRRKMLRQSLKTLSVDAGAFLAEANIEPTARAEEIPVEGFVALARVFTEQSKTGA